MPYKNAESKKAWWKRYNQDHYAEIRENQKRYKSTLKGKFTKWKESAKHRNIAFDLTLDDLEKMPLICHYTGVPLSLKQNEYTTVSLDRLNNNEGYTKKNVVFCCGFINVMKNTLSYDQFVTACGTIFHHCSTKSISQ